MVNSVRFGALDAWRGMCAVLIVVFHFIALLPSPLTAVSFIRNAYLFVDFFFVLSGFVLCHGYRGRIRSIADLSRFAVRRFGRVWPLHALVLAAVLVAVLFINAWPHPRDLTFAWDATGYAGRALLPQFFLLNAMGLQANSWNGPAWSIGAEFYTYMVFALLLLFVARRIVVSAALLVPAALAIVFWNAPDLMNATWDYGFVRCLAGFFGGVIAYHVYERRERQPFVRATVREVAAVVLVVGFVVWAGEGPDSVGALSLAAPLVFGIAVVIFAGEDGFLSLLLRAKPFQALGRYSYSIYMIHMPLLVMLCYGMWSSGYATKAFGPGQGWKESSVLVLINFLLAVVLLAAASHRFIENPARDRFNRLANRIDRNGGRARPLMSWTA
jgi:peptidoglycan/LPS O-acetylase OafA/YrhL